MIDLYSIEFTFDNYESQQTNYLLQCFAMQKQYISESLSVFYGHF